MYAWTYNYYITISLTMTHTDDLDTYVSCAMLTIIKGNAISPSHSRLCIKIYNVIKFMIL